MSQPKPQANIGVVGLAVMGSNLARNLASREGNTVAIYNRTSMQIAPHILYTRHDDLFIDGVAMLRDGKVPAELKLGTFKLAGLNNVSLTAEAFTVQPLYDSTDAKYEGVTVTKVG